MEDDKIVKVARDRCQQAHETTDGSSKDGMTIYMYNGLTDGNSKYLPRIRGVGKEIREGK